MNLFSQAIISGLMTGAVYTSLGVGLVPCTGAVLVMIFALANGILAAGLVLVAAIAVGMAATMAGLGVLSIVARQAMVARFAGDERRHARLGSALELLGAAAITAIGALLFLGALDAPPQLG